ncbi:alginate lyase family protein [soil metagenome]
MSFPQRLRRLLRNPPREILRKSIAFGQRRREELRLSLRDRVNASFPEDSVLPAGPLAPLIAPIAPEAFSAWRLLLLHRANQVCQHQFDLLGSGLVTVKPGIQAKGMEGYRYTATPSHSVNAINAANRAKAIQLRARISPAYEAIDWHLDFRSGYRWPSDVPSSAIVYGVLPGVDVKLPWELARMQHAPWLALAYSQFLLQGDEINAARMRVEFQDQFLDFTAANPPRFGVNWACTMDVAIRIVNLLIAYDLLRGFGVNFDAEFELEFKRSLFAHGRHIVDNLEWFPHLRSNHYLSNIAGLLFVAASLPASAESDAWLALAANELGKETFAQFQPDGSNFEASTSYHRLSAEMVLYSVALAHRVCERLNRIDLARSMERLQHRGPGLLPAERSVPAPHGLTDPATSQLLAKMAEFSAAVTRPDGGATQVGDNDSGRFVKLCPDESHGDANGNRRPNDHRGLIAGIEALCGDRGKPASIEALVVRAMMGDLAGPIAAADDIAMDLSAPKVLPTLAAFPDFGIFVFRRPDLWLAVRCGAVGQLGNGGHAHNDQLSIELCLGGVAFIVDPGTYVYTPLPDSRNGFRSTAFHATLLAAPGEQNGWLQGREGLFSMSRVANTRVIEVLPSRFVGEHDGFARPHRREIDVSDASIEVIDRCDADARMIVLPLAPEVQVTPDSGRRGCMLERDGVSVAFRIDAGEIDIVDTWYSPRYGVKLPTKAMHVKAVPPVCHWQLLMQSKRHG